jgi:hypothetical protein
MAFGTNALKDVEREGKLFNKGISDVKILSMIEAYAMDSRINNDFVTWCSVLDSWLNRLSPDLSVEELEKIDTDLNSVRNVLRDRTAMAAVRSKLNSVERKLYKIEHELQISNPMKNQGGWMNRQEDFNRSYADDEDDDEVDKEKLVDAPEEDVE